MARQDVLRNALAQAYADLAGSVSFHEGDPGDDGTANESDIDREDLSWPDDPDAGLITSAEVTIGVAEGQVFTHFVIWSNADEFMDVIANSITFDSTTTYVFQIADQE